MTRGGTAAAAALVAFAALALDQLTKALVRALVERGESVDVVLGVEVVNVRNDGVAFGLFGGSATLVLIITLIAAGGLLYYLLTQAPRPGQWIAIGLLAGGAAGNLFDRIRAGEVTDFIDLPSWPAFNVADIAITLGIAALIANELWADWRSRGER